MNKDEKDSKRVFEHYAEQYQKYNEAKAEYPGKKETLRTLEKQCEELERKHEEITHQKEEAQNGADFDLEAAEERIRVRYERLFAEAEQQYSNRIREIAEKKDNRTGRNEEQYRTGMQKFQMEGCVLSKDALSWTEQELYGFAFRKESLLNEKLKKANEAEDERNRLNLESDRQITIYQEQQNDILKEYEGDIKEKSDVVRSIEEKHFPGIQKLEETIHNIEAEYAEITANAKYERKREVGLAESEKQSLEKQYKDTDRRFKKQISLATRRKEPVAQLKAQHNSTLKNIQDSITKKEAEINKLNLKFDKKLDGIQEKQQKEISRVKAQKDQLTAARDEELAVPGQELDAVTRERDGKINEIEEKKNRLDEERKKALDESGRILEVFNRNADEKLDHLKNELIQYAVKNGLAVEEQSAEVFAPFMSMKANLPDWMKALRQISGPGGKVDEIIDNSVTVLADRTYDELAGIAGSSGTWSRTAPFYMKDFNDKAVLAFAAALLLGTVLKFLIQMPVIAAYGLPLAAGVAYVIFAYRKRKELQLKWGELIYLANHYKTFAQVSSRVKMLTENATYEKVSAIADEIYCKVSGPELLQKKYREEKEDIQKDFENESALAREQYAKNSAVLTSENRREIQELRASNADEQKRYFDRIAELDLEIAGVEKERKQCEKQIEILSEELRDDEALFESFEEEHHFFKQNLLNLSAPVEETKGILRDDIYLVPTDDEACSDEYHHLPLLHVEHDKRPILILIDLRQLEKDGSYQEKAGAIVNNCLLDFMLAFKNMNGNEIIEQYVVDEVGGGHQLRGDRFKNLLQIKKVGESIGELQMYFKEFKRQRESYANKGITIHDYNSVQTQRGERPDTYHICYLVLRSERCAGFSEHISSLMKHGWDYGFLPVFVCDREVWEQNKEKPETALHEISMNISAVVRFNGRTYEEDENE